MYAKLINGVLKKAPNKVNHGNKVIFNPQPDVLEKLGYLPVRETDMPMEVPEGKHYEESYEQNGLEIVQTWRLVNDMPEIPSIEERTEALEAAMLELAEVMANG